MGVKSTREILRGNALSMVEILLSRCSDEALAQVLETLNDDARERGDEYNYLGLLNFRILRATRACE